MKKILFWGIGLFAAFFVVVTISTISSMDFSKIGKPIPYTQHQQDSIAVINDSISAEKAMETRKLAIKSQFNNWDGSHINLEQSIKKSIADPNSYEHVATNYDVIRDTLYILTDFRAKNAYGGKVVTRVKGVYTLEGKQVLAEFLD